MCKLKQWQIPVAEEEETKTNSHIFQAESSNKDYPTETREHFSGKAKKKKIKVDTLGKQLSHLVDSAAWNVTPTAVTC